jgi:hypothetical protein
MMEESTPEKANRETRAQTETLARWKLVEVPSGAVQGNGWNIPAK